MAVSQEPRRTVSSLVLAIIILVGLVGGLAGAGGVTMYWLGHPVISTVSYSTTNTVSQTQTQTSYSCLTETQISVTTAISTQNYNYGIPNYNYQNNCNYNTCYPSNPGQTTTIYGYVSPNQGNECVYFQVPVNGQNQGYAQYQYYALYGETPPTGWVSLTGYVTTAYSGCSGTGFYVTAINQ